MKESLPWNLVNRHHQPLVRYIKYSSEPWSHEAAYEVAHETWPEVKSFNWDQLEYINSDVHGEKRYYFSVPGKA